MTDSAPVGGFLLHDASLDPDAPELAGRPQLRCLPWSERESAPAGARVLLCLGDEQIRDLAGLALERGWEVGLLPHPDAHKAMAAMGVRGTLEQLLDHYEGARAIEADVLTCNGELVFTSVVIGRVLALRPFDINRPQTGWSMLRGALAGLSGLQLASFQVTTGKDRKISLAALGMVALGNTRSSLVGRSFEDTLSISDGRLSLLALAPRSVLAYLLFLLRLLLPRKIQLSRLPRSLGLIQSDRLHLKAHRGLEYLLDGKPVHAAEIEFAVAEGRLQLLPGPALALRRDEAPASDKETVRLNDVPVDDGARALQEKSLPLFRHATEGEYRELFVSLRDNAQASSTYQVLMILSVLLALAGLYANSAPVIIGAMILAPLMAPIVSLAMGLARSEVALIRSASLTLGVGVAWGLLCAVLLAWAMPLDIPTSEMRARMSPTLLDLFVAVVSGIAGAYAYSREEIAKSLAGVAIAVALVPPLGVAGIGLGWGDWEMARGAGLLLTTNLVGIALAASVTFLVLGFAPFERARRGLGFTLGIMLVISVPLYIAFDHLVERGRIEQAVPRTLEIGDTEVAVRQVQVLLETPPLVRVVLSSRTRLDDSQIDYLKDRIVESVGRPVALEAQLSIRR